MIFLWQKIDPSRSTDFPFDISLEFDKKLDKMLELLLSFHTNLRKIYVIFRVFVFSYIYVSNGAVSECDVFVNFCLSCVESYQLNEIRFSL